MNISEYRGRKVEKVTNLRNWYKVGLNGVKLWQFPLARIFEYDASQEPKFLTANYHGRCDDTLFLMK